MMSDNEKFRLILFSISVGALLVIAFLVTVSRYRTTEMAMKNGYQQDKGGNWVKGNTLVVHE